MPDSVKVYAVAVPSMVPDTSSSLEVEKVTVPFRIK
jgi:hypothetical protein